MIHDLYAYLLYVGEVILLNYYVYTRINTLILKYIHVCKYNNS